MSLVMILGAMCSGKTTEMMRRVARYRAIQWHVTVINSTKDTRCGSGQVRSHSGQTDSAIKSYHLQDVTQTIPRGSVVAIDEAQFFTDLVVMVKLWVNSGVHVILSGLNGDYRGEPFGPILQLISFADEVVWKRAYCAKCKDGTLASFSQRIVNGDEVEQVGGKEMYVSVCRSCYRRP